jgi:hypothetical protein
MVRIRKIEVKQNGFIVNNTYYYFFDKIQNFHLETSEGYYIPVDFNIKDELPKCTIYRLHINSEIFTCCESVKSQQYFADTIEECTKWNDEILNLFKVLKDLI